MKIRNNLRLAIFGLVLTTLLTGCAEESVTAGGSTGAASTPTPTATQGEQSWGEVAPENTLADTPSGYVYVDRDGPDSAGSYFWHESADDSTKPGEIVGPGVYLMFHIVFQNVPRAVADAYVATDPEGKDRGPTLDCSPGQYLPPGEFDPVYDPDSFDCIAAFTDPAYESGTYYGVIVSEPSSRDQASYGSKTTILAAYTRIADVDAGDVITTY